MSLHLRCTLLAAGLLSGPLAAQAPAAWRLSDAPVFAVGSEAGSGAPAFGRVAGATRQRSGHVVVVDGGRLALSRFSPEGRLVYGSEPGRAARGGWLVVNSARGCGGDSTFVYDGASRRITVHAPDGAYARTIEVWRWGPEGLPPYNVWCGRDGTLALVHRSPVWPDSVGPRRPTVGVAVVGRDGSVATLGSFPGPERYFEGQNEFPRPLGRPTSAVVGDGVVYVGTGDAHGVAAFALDGRPLGRIGGPRPAVPIVPAHVDAYIARAVARREVVRNPAAGERVLRGLPYPAELPAHGELLVDAGGRLWIEDYPVPGAASREWRVYSRDGAAVATVVVPADLRVLEAGEDYVLGAWTDEAGAHSVRIYSLEK